MSAILTHCNVCTKPFSQDDFHPLPEERIVFTVCHHIFHQLCLSRWVDKSEKNCPLCKALIYKHQSGKDYTVYISIFLSALQHDPAIVSETLKSSEHKNDICSAECLENFPMIPLRYDPQKEELVHEKCVSSSQLLPLYIQDLVNIVKKIVKKDHKLREKFIPTPPTYLQWIRTDYPLLFKVISMGSISITAFLLNYYKYQGKSLILSTAGLPAYSAFLIAKQAGLLIIVLLNSQYRPMEA